MSSPSTPPQATPMRELGLIKRLFSMLDDVTQDEIVIALDALIIELEHEAAQAAHQRVRRIAINAWRQTIRRNTAARPPWRALPSWKRTNG
ncbi:MAG TPA: hypothetical protein VFT01_05105 [Homoserinimonas sp.]|nr:hypothetical protein [Homoserinimonas sp.]